MAPAVDSPWELSLPPLLATTYGAMLDAEGLRAEAECKLPNDDGPQGGLTRPETLAHFARSFPGSAARTQLVFLDPSDRFRTTRDLLVQAFAGGELDLLDVPCGCGASSALLLCLVAELRTTKVLPSLPLRVSITGWDL